MSVYIFDGADDVVDFSIGGCSSTGTWTLVSVVEFNAGVSWQSLLSLDIAATGSEIAIGRSGSSGQIAAFRGGGAGGIADAISVSSSDNWALIAASKATAGTTTVRLHKGVVGGAWTHTDGETLANVSAQESIRFGAIDSSDFFAGKCAVIAKWNTGLSDANLESLLTSFTRTDWLALSPAGLWDGYDQFATDRTGGGATRTAIVGTTVETGDVPTGWASWDGGGGGGVTVKKLSALGVG